jgi:hypothetical protein
MTMEDRKASGKRRGWIAIIAVSLAVLSAFWIGSDATESLREASSSLRDNGGKHRVFGHSMEPVLRGGRLPASCARCDAQMRVFESRSAAPLWLCPHCGEPLKAGGKGGVEGELVTVKPLGAAGQVERDELVVFRDAARGLWHVKRVVGLPGERLAIERGDLKIDGRVIRKSIWRFLQSASLLAVWRPQSQESQRWYCPDGQEAVLRYRHWSPWPRNSSGYPLQPTTVTDEDWRDADQSWPMTCVDDIGMVMDFSDLSAGFSMEVEGYHPIGRWLVQLHRMESGGWEATVGSSGSPHWKQFPAKELKASSSTSVRIVVAHIDSAVRVGIEGGEEHLWLWPLPSNAQGIEENQEENKEGAVVSATQPLQIRWSKSSGRLTKARVVRDVHYRGPHGEANWEALVPGSYLYLLGDHPSGSLDSRQQGPLRLEIESLFGRVVPPSSWSERLELQERDLGPRKTDVFP